MKVSAGPADILDKSTSQGILPVASYNPGFTVERPAIAVGTKGNAMVGLELLKKP